MSIFVISDSTLDGSVWKTGFTCMEDCIKEISKFIDEIEPVDPIKPIWYKEIFVDGIWNVECRDCGLYFTITEIEVG